MLPRPLAGRGAGPAGPLALLIPLAPLAPLIPLALRVIEVTSAVPRGYRIGDENMVDAIRAVRCTRHGFAMLQATNGFQRGGDIDEAFGKLIDFMDHGPRGPVLR